MFRPSILLLGVVFSVSGLTAGRSESASPDRDVYGGWTGIRGEATGFFHTQRMNGTWWIITPEGNGFLSKGVNSIRGPGKHPLKDEEVPGIRNHIVSWGMNTAGCWSDPALEGPGLCLALRCRVSNAPDKGFPDVFDPKWRSMVSEAAVRECTPHRDDPRLLGYFTDNELPWKHDDQAMTFLEEFLKLPENSPGKLEAQKAKAGGEMAARDFRERVAEIYFAATAGAIRAADPNHMILGCRFAGRPPLGVVARMRLCADIVSINNYSPHPPLPLIREMSRAAGLPVMVTEFSFKGPAPGLATNGSGPLMPSQAERAASFTRYAEDILREPCCVGYHWFKYGDNWQGVLQADGNPWPELISAFTDLSARAESLHR